MREDYESCRRIAFSEMIRWESSKAEEEVRRVTTKQQRLSFTFQQLFLRSLTLVPLESNSPQLHLSAYDEFLEYAFGRNAVRGMKGALIVIRMALTALGWMRKLPGWLL